VRRIHAFAELEDLVGVGQGQASGFGRHQAAALRRQQRLAQRLFELGDLALMVCTATPSRRAARVTLPSRATTQK
jgi:replicative superfamily II helicase